MNDANVLDLGEALYAEPARRWPRPRIAWLAAACGLLALASLQLFGGPGLSGVWKALGFASPASAEATIRLNLEAKRAVASMTEGAQAEIVVQGADAEARNALIPISGAPLQTMRSFLIAKAVQDTGAGPAGNALKCLTQAVYYEAANEPIVGRRAVAQVILNRMRHPAYPKSVCGVIYQGWERSTGCQFSFTCDGSLLRTPMRSKWLEAEGVARAALAGYVEPSVGSATFYHANYVLPKWAFTLNKLTQIGAHIFYRFPGAWGEARTFSGGYSGIERIPDINYASLQARLAAEAAVAGDAGLPADIVIAPDPTDRRAANDIGGRINPLKQWRLNIPAPDEASSRYRSSIDGQGGDDDDISSGPIPTSNSAASATQ